MQLDIRTGHAQTVEKVLTWLKTDGNLAGTTVCDAGCGTGSLAIPVALAGAAVEASDISSSMADEAQRRFESAVAGGAVAPAKARTAAPLRTPPGPRPASRRGAPKHETRVRAPDARRSRRASSRATWRA